MEEQTIEFRAGWEESVKFKGIFITPNQINKIIKNFKEISKVKFIINTKNLLDYGELLCETDSQDNKLKNKIKDFLKPILSLI